MVLAGQWFKHIKPYNIYIITQYKVKCVLQVKTIKTFLRQGMMRKIEEYTPIILLYCFGFYNGT